MNFYKVNVVTKLFFIISIFSFCVPLFVEADTSIASSGNAACVVISRNLSFGQRNSDVAVLQKFLIDSAVLDSDSATGYFGFLTQAAVQKWQSQNGIVSAGMPSTTGFGAVGPRTRLIMNCNTNGTVRSDTPSDPTKTPTSPVTFPTNPRPKPDIPRVTFPAPDTTSTVSDFFIQNVCLDASGNVLAESPLSSKCTETRNLRFGEKLPYHKNDLNGTDTNPAALNGYQRSDSFPLNADATTIVQSLDFGVGGAVFGRMDTNDGFNVYETKGIYASATATKDAVGGLQYFISPACASGNGNEDAWGVFPTALQGSSEKSHLFSIAIGTSQSTCPTAFAQSLTTWEFPSDPLTYTSGVKLVSAISYHYSNATIAASDHLEKFYFTKEYGATRWERWERPNTAYHSGEKERADAKAAAGVCNGVSVTYDATGPWYRVDCREWTHIILESGASSTWYDPGTWSISKTDTAAMPDLTVSATATITGVVGTPFTMMGTVKNIGGGATPSSFQNFWRVCDAGCVSYNKSGSEYTPALGAGSSRSISFSHTLTTAGTYYYTICADLPASLAESNEDNNCSTGSITISQSSAPFTPTTPAGTPDLNVSGLQAVTTTAGTPFTVSATVNNIGSAATPSTFQDFWRLCDAGCATYNQYGSEYTAILGQGSSRAISFTHTLSSAGTYYYTVCADLPATITEFNEDNNCTNTVITVNSAPTPTPVPPGVPDLTISTGGSLTATVGTPFAMTGTVNNTGTGATSVGFNNFWRICDLGCSAFNEYGYASTLALNAGASRAVSFPYTLNTAGTYYYTLCADLPAGITESNEDNNCSIAASITVAAH